MEWLPILLISGLCTSPSHQQCLVETPKSWDDAQSYCRERGSDLATIKNMGAMRSLLPMVSGKPEVWIGLKAVVTDKTHWFLDDQGEEDYRNKNSRAYSSVYHLRKDGLWHGGVTTDPKFSVCYDANKQGRDRYVLVKQLLEFYDAKAYCRNHHTDLVAIRNATENEIIKEVSLGNNVWIGLFTDNWAWSDNQRSSFRFWPENEMKDLAFPFLCAYIGTQSGRWGSANCRAQHQFFCACSRTTVLKVKVNSEGLQDLNDPATKAAILKQIQQLVGGPNSTNGHMMTWRTQADGQVFTKEQGQHNKWSSPIKDGNLTMKT